MVLPDFRFTLADRNHRTADADLNRIPHRSNAHHFEGGARRRTQHQKMTPVIGLSPEELRDLAAVPNLQFIQNHEKSL